MIMCGSRGVQTFKNCCSDVVFGLECQQPFVLLFFSVQIFKKKKNSYVVSKYQPQPFEGEDDKWREWVWVFRSWSGRFFGGALAEIYGHVEGHRDDSATILDLTLSSLRFDAGWPRNISTELYHVLIKLTRGRA